MEVRDMGDSLSDGLTNPSDNENESFPYKENEVLSKDLELELSITNLNLGEKRGRPRKNTKISHFFDCRRKVNKKKSSSTNINTYFPHKSNDKEMLYAIVPMSKANMQARTSDTSDKDNLANQIVEVGEFLGLITSVDREQVLKIISNSIQN